jgi:transcriptional regulator with XRE-family HTH domain
MSQTEKTDPGLVERQVSADQLVAFNMATYRKTLGLTQEDLAQLLEWHTGRPWSKASVSAAERSFDGDRTKYFSAEQLLALAASLDVSVSALLLPPPDDGMSVRYILAPLPEPHRLDMRDVYFLLFPSDSSTGASIDLYRSRREALEEGLLASRLDHGDGPRSPSDQTALADRLDEQRRTILSVARQLEADIGRLRNSAMNPDAAEGDG